MVFQCNKNRTARPRIFDLVIFIVILLIPTTGSAQHYTYFEGSTGIYSMFIPGRNVPFSIRDGSLLDGSGYHLSLRQQMGTWFSLELGYSKCNLRPALQVVDRPVLSGGSMFRSDRFFLKTNVDVKVFRDRIAAYGSIGTTYSFEDKGGVSAVGLCNPSNVLIEYTYLPGTGKALFLSAGAGIRFRLIHELLLECEWGYNTSLQEMYRFTVHYEDPAGTSFAQTLEEGKDQFYFRFGFAYPLQPVCRLLGKSVDFLLAL